jgi:methylphosphotriester-DNA--protein-cysteine methyltransferase
VHGSVLQLAHVDRELPLEAALREQLVGASQLTHRKTRMDQHAQPTLIESLSDLRKGPPHPSRVVLGGASWLGLSPKQLLSIGQLQYALRLLQSGTSLARTAALAGFVDQAHMAHVVRRATERPPRAWAQARPTELGTAYARVTGGELVTL